MLEKPKVVVVFDSGVGGLTVFQELKKRNINENFVYLADSANSPYGDKTKEQIIISVLQSFKKLSYQFDFKAIVVACNTASVYTIDILEHLYSVPVYSVIDAAVNYINQRNINETIDVLGTSLTANSHAYRKALPNHYIREIGCPSFVPFIESNDYFFEEKRKKIVTSQLIGRATTQACHVVLGCTHYPHLEKELQSFYGIQCNIINPSLILGENLSKVFPKRTTKFNAMYYTTAFNPYFDIFASRLMEEKVESLILNNIYPSNITNCADN